MHLLETIKIERAFKGQFGCFKKHLIVNLSEGGSYNFQITS